MGSTLLQARSNQLRLIQRWFAGNRKLLIIAGAILAVGLAIALPASMASTHRVMSSVTVQPDRAKHKVSEAVAHTPSTGCHVTYTPTNWPGDFTANVTIDNRGTTAINGWKLTFTFPGDESISSAWNTTFTQTGARVLATNTNYDVTIPRGASQSLGFLGTWTSNDTAPTSFSVNGTACS
jgi:predicted small secreted protein